MRMQCRELREEPASSCTCKRYTQPVSKAKSGPGERGTSTATHSQASKSDFPLWADAEAEVQSQWLRKVTEGGITAPVNPVGQTPALLLSPDSQESRYQHLDFRQRRQATQTFRAPTASKASTEKMMQIQVKAQGDFLP